MPVSYNELSRRQLLCILKILNSKVLRTRAYLKMLFVLTKIDRINFMLASADELAEYFYLVEFFALNNDLTKNLIPKYRSFYGPADDFDNIIGEEYTFADLFFSRYKNGDKTSIDLFIAALYRPRKKNYDKKANPDGDVREEFNRNLMERNANKIKSWPAPMKEAIAVWYEGCRKRLVQTNPRIYGGEGGDPPQYGMWSIMRSLAEKGIHGTFTAIEKMKIKELHMEMNELIRESDRIKTAYK